MTDSTARPRRRLGEVPDRYALLLVFILADCVVFFCSGSRGLGRWLPGAMIAITVLFGLRTSRVEGRLVVVARVLTGALVALILLAALFQSRWLYGWVGIAGGAAIAVLTIAILFRVLRHEHVTIQTILGAICVYVLFGLVFAFVEYGIGEISEKQFFVQITTSTLADNVYFSFVTLTTLGFGDLTPATNVGRGLVSFQALLGQVFLVTLVARLVSLYQSPRST